MSTIKLTNNHPIKKRKTLGPVGRFLLKLVNWDIVGNLPDKKRIIIASAPHSSTFDAIYAYIVCLATDLKFYFLGSVSMFTRIVVPLPFKKILTNLEYHIHLEIFKTKCYLILEVYQSGEQNRQE